MARNRIIENIILRPAAALFGLGVWVRDMMFAGGVLKSRQFDIPVICVGNIAVGGTGKTPHVEHLVKLLRASYKVGVLSRGYGRKTKGFIHIGKDANPVMVGDEPYQMFRKFGEDVMFAVCENRVEGIERMRKINPDLQLILLDDAFQHRYVKPSTSIVLTEFSRPLFFDHLMPHGRLREPASALSRCDMVIVTKCPFRLKPIEYRIFKDKLNLCPYQHLFFSHLIYTHPRPLFAEVAREHITMENLTDRDAALCVTAIANPRPFVTFLRRHKAVVKMKSYPDHHYFSKSDYDDIRRRFDELRGNRRFIFVTEKDAVKIINDVNFPESLKPYIYFIPVEVTIEPDDDTTFEQEILKSVAQFKKD